MMAALRSPGALVMRVKAEAEALGWERSAFFDLPAQDSGDTTSPFPGQ